MKIILAWIFAIGITGSALAVPCPKFRTLVPTPKFKVLVPVPKFTPLQVLTVEQTGHWETRCNGSTCQKVWVDGPEVKKQPSKPAVRRTRRRWFR